MQVIRRVLRALVLLFLVPLAWSQPLERPAAMAPLIVSDWAEFKAQIARAKAIGITAISTDVWWGTVEGVADQQFDWSYYDKVSDAILGAGLKWVPILSFHQCGGNVGDACDIPIPAWLWSRLGGPDPSRLKYRSEAGNESSEVIALWADELARDQYLEFIAAFRDHFRGLADRIAEINLSAGPSGELRYPSYNSHDRFRYPGRGYLQAYSESAKDDFRRFVRDKYATLERVEQAWNIRLADWTEIRPPSDADGFFGRRHHLDIQYGRDFTEWYNGALVKHGRFMIGLAREALGDAFQGVPIGIKIPGVHWLMNSPVMPRAAEVTAGLIPTNIDVDADRTAHGYAPIIDMVRQASASDHPLILHFTCLEMDNEAGAPNYSLAKDLVFWVAQGAQRAGATIMGENALSAGVSSDRGWDNIDNAIRWSGYSGLTALRIGDLAVNYGLGFQRYQRLIEQFRPRGAQP